jgi:hypothetical protein
MGDDLGRETYNAIQAVRLGERLMGNLVSLAHWTAKTQVHISSCSPALMLALRHVHVCNGLRTITRASILTQAAF